MSKTEHRGRPKDNDEPLLKYTQTLTDYDGSYSIWYWDKSIRKNGPLSVEFFDPTYNTLEKLNKEKNKLESKYIQKEGGRKIRILKVDKQRLLELENLINEEMWELFPEDRPKIRKKRTLKKQ